MKIEIFNDENKIDVDNVKFKDFTEETQHRKNLLLNFDLNFSYVKLLNGDKILLDIAFQQQKQESLN
jgi:hypothetical protein